MKFQILIPTYNRREDLRKNLAYLKEQLNTYKLTNEFGIIVSDNASNDGTFAMLEQLSRDWKNEISLKIVKNETNIGLEKNTVNLLQSASAEYIIWLGDDDLLADGYLSFINEQFIDGKLGWMTPGIIGVSKNGEKSIGRVTGFDHKLFQPGFDSLLMLSHLGHSMSGLVVKKENLAKNYLAIPQWRNPYLFIYFLAYNQLFNAGVYAPGYKTIVNNYNQKDWSYNEIGLLDEVFKSYYYLKEIIGIQKLNRLLLRFILMHSYRINFEKGYGFVLKQWKIILDNAKETKGFKLPLLKLLTKEYLVRKIKWK